MCISLITGAVVQALGPSGAHDVAELLTAASQVVAVAAVQLSDATAQCAAACQSLLLLHGLAQASNSGGQRTHSLLTCGALLATVAGATAQHGVSHTRSERGALCALLQDAAAALISCMPTRTAIAAGAPPGASDGDEYMAWTILSRLCIRLCAVHTVGGVAPRTGSHEWEGILASLAELLEVAAGRGMSLEAVSLLQAWCAAPCAEGSGRSAVRASFEEDLLATLDSVCDALQGAKTPTSAPRGLLLLRVAGTWCVSVSGPSGADSHSRSCAADSQLPA